MIALLFPGQGSQYVGMGRDLMEHFPILKQRFEEANVFFAPTGMSLMDIVFEGPDSLLTQTQWAQPALFTLSASLIDLLWQHSDSNSFHYVAGHSLGEYSALYAAKCFSFQEGLTLIQARCNAMASVHNGGMVAVLKLSIEAIEELIAQYGQSTVEIANDNCPGQIVISGDQEALEGFIPHAQALGARCISLKVSGPFHTSFMKPAASLFMPHLQSISMSNPQLPVVTNVSAQPQQDATTLKTHLAAQLTGQVRWRETLHTLHHLGVTQYLEVGPGNVLSGLLGKTIPGAKISGLGNVEPLSEWLSSQHVAAETLNCSK
jgi:[acyl-carrier-protein] S-malonyltransferase